MRGIGLGLGVLWIAACRVLPPPPIMPPHAVGVVDEPGAITAMLVVGVADQLMNGGAGWGLAVRVERQQTDRTTVGLELSGGRGDRAQFEDGTRFRHWLIGARGYGRYAVGGPLTVMSGLGLSWTASGLVTGTLDAGVSLAPDFEHAIPVWSVGAALAVPLRHGRAYAALPGPQIMFGPPEPGMKIEPQVPRYEIPQTLGLLVPFGDTGHRMSVDLTLATTMRKDSVMLTALSLADAQRFAP